jgi:hypothetical protein
MSEPVAFLFSILSLFHHLVMKPIRAQGHPKDQEHQDGGPAYRYCQRVADHVFVMEQAVIEQAGEQVPHRLASEIEEKQ